MSFEKGITIASAIEDIENNRLLLPEFQREFVWTNTKIEWLFDSIMHNYPISSLLFWRVEGSTKHEHKFYRFLENFRERFQTHNQGFVPIGVSDITAVLDGQQRLGSIYIGLRGSYAYKKPRVWWDNTEENIPTRHLYLNISGGLKDEEDGRVYDFKFLTEGEYNDEKEKWFKVGDILGLKNFHEFDKFLDKQNYKLNDFAWEGLSRLQQAIHTDEIINYFLVKDQNLDKALNIFIRINSGGEPLKISDILMSIAEAKWTKRDARKEIHNLVDEIRAKGFFISKDLVLKTFLVLYSKDIKFKATNFSKDNVEQFEDKWDNIKLAMQSAFDLIKSYGFDDLTLTSKNAIIPIIFYLYHRDICKGFCTNVGFEKDREIIKRWLHIVLLKRIFGGQSDTILSDIRSVFVKSAQEKEIKIDSSIKEFPHDLIVEKLKGTTKDMSINDAYIENLLLTQYNDPLCFSILAILYPHLDYQNRDFNKDHIFAESCFNEKGLKKRNVREDLFDFYLNPHNYNSILNLQFLDSNENKSKQDADLGEWVMKESKKKGLSQKEFCDRHLFPEILDITEFQTFIAERRKTLKGILSELV